MALSRIFVPRLNDPRERFRFVSEPLGHVGVDVEVLDSRTVKGLAATVRTVAKPSSGTVIIVGVGLKPLVIAMAARFGRKKVVLRMGGDTRRDAREVIRSSIAARDYKSAFRTAINLTTLPLLFALSRNIVVVNQSLVEQIRPHISAKSRFFVVPQPVFGSAEVRHADTPSVFKLLTITNLRYRRKADGVIWQIERLKTIAEGTSGPVRFRIAGGGLHLKDVENHIASMPFPGNFQVDLLGHVADVDAEYAKADVFLYRSDHDGTPNVLLEAKRWGLPIVVNDYAPFQNLVENGTSGIIYEDEFGFLKGIVALRDNDSLGKRLGKAGQEDFCNRFSITAVGERLANMLDEIFLGPETPAPKTTN